MFAILFGGIGLATGAGLNAYLPLLVLVLADRTTGIVDLPTPYNWLSSFWGITLILLLLPFELIPDKIARVDHYNDLMHAAIRPAAGALAFMAYASQSDEFQLVFAMILGLAIAGGVTSVKSAARSDISRRSRGVGNPVVSALEDVVSLACAICGTLVPFSVIVIVPFGLALLNRSYQRIRNGTSRLYRLVPDVHRTGNVS